jgi:hypothetical protein
LVLDFVEGCDFEEFNKYLAKLGQYTAVGELERLKRSLERVLRSLSCFVRMVGWLVMRFGMRRLLMSTGKAIQETRLTGTFCADFWAVRVILLNCMNSG